MELRWIEPGASERLAVLELRRAVLRKPLGLDFSAQDIASEARDLNLTLWMDGRLAGCLLLRDKGNGTAQMRQVAVAQTFQGRGLGRALVLEFEAECARRGFKRVMLHARQDATGFYRRLGYQNEGKPFVEIGLTHQTMVKELERPTER